MSDNARSFLKTLISVFAVKIMMLIPSNIQLIHILNKFLIGDFCIN